MYHNTEHLDIFVIYIWNKSFQLTFNPSWAYSPSLTEKLFAEEQCQLLGINSEFDNNNAYINRTTSLESKSTQRQTFPHFDLPLNESSFFAYADLKLVNCGIIHESDSESSIDDDEETFLKDSMMEELQSNSHHPEDDENSMDCIDTTGKVKTNYHSILLYGIMYWWVAYKN